MIKKRLKIIFAILIFIQITNSITIAQTKLPEFSTGVSVLGAVGDAVPFWLVSLREGKYLPQNSAAAFNMSIIKTSNQTNKIEFEYGMELFAKNQAGSELWLHQGYGAVTFYNILQAKAGLWTEIVGSKEPNISTGSIIWSGNARPIPRIQIATPGYITVPFTFGLGEVSASFAHGWFEKDRFVDGVLMHHKNFYARIGGWLPVNIYYGLNHYAMWGGKAPNLDLPFPSDFRSFLRVVRAESGDPEMEGTPAGWVINRFGNHIGSRNYGLDFNFKRFSTGIYLQDVLEDNSGLSRKNFPDGLWGWFLRFKDENRLINAIVYEFLQTTDQSGPIHDIDGVILGGNDNYFNHGNYHSGWTYHKYTIGTPLLTSPIFNESGSVRIENNRVIAHHLGFEGKLAADIRYRTLLTLSRNFGRHSIPYDERKDQFSGLIEIGAPLGFYGIDGKLSIAADIGKMYGNSFGLLFGVTKKWN